MSLTYNDDYKLDEWRVNYEIFKDQIDVYIIVDNASKSDYKKKLRIAFPEAIIIERETNGGCTGAYNDGIKYALDQTDSDSILIISNDLRATKKCIPRMYDYLMSNQKLGIVSSAILFKDSQIVDNYGHTIRGIKVSCCCTGMNVEDLEPKSKFTDLVSGGFTLAKRSYYEKAGLQDNNLFMYCDEIDTTFKALNSGFKIGVIADEYAWHWHINPPSTGRRSSSSRYLITRNRVYLAKKYIGQGEALKQLLRGVFITSSIYLYHYLKSFDSGYLKDAYYSFMGSIHGFLRMMNKYSYINFG